MCNYYSKIAFYQFPDLPSELKRLAWLSLDSQEGQEYWNALELMGQYAAANHACIHQHIAEILGAQVLLDLEMEAQRDLVTVLGQFDPKLVKMAPAGERPED